MQVENRPSVLGSVSLGWGEITDCAGLEGGEGGWLITTPHSRASLGGKVVSSLALEVC